jgi:uracil-DNA glycosylase family 4
MASELAPPATPKRSVSRLVQLDIVRQEVAACVKCPHLAAARTQTVFGVGNPHPRLCFVGEAPGADEDRLGEPFVGRAGQLLTKIIEACTLRREDVYILNVLKCRPPDNRTPLPDEISNCRGYLNRQLEILTPEFICCLGSTAARALLNTEQSIGKLRGRFHDYQGTTVLCTYHPSYLLRNPNAKRDVWEDMKLLMGKMGIELGNQK